MRSVRRLFVTAALVAVTCAIPAHSAVGASSTTAWKSGVFGVDVPGVVQRSNLVLTKAGTVGGQSMPLGNGTLGAAVWSASGLTAQLNRVDTFPDRKSPGQLTIPGLSHITSAADYRGTLNLYDGTFVESGGGMTARGYVRADKDELVVDVTGASPSVKQTAKVALWTGRSPKAAAGGKIATLAETWTDNSTEYPHGSSGATFGSLAAITVGGRSVTASVVDSRTVAVSFTPNSDGSFRVVVAAPHWAGGDAASAASSYLGSDASATSVPTSHLAWWHSYWSKVGLIEIGGSDTTSEGAYVENLRDIDLYTAAAYSRGQLPGSHAGVADLFNWNKDTQRWFPAGYWHWNLRMQVAANLGAGNASLNAPFFNLYTSNLAAMQQWTKAQIGGKGDDVCVPETVRFNGNGYYIRTSSNPNHDVDGASCIASIAPGYNARTLTTGAEVGLWIWQQYLYTGDTAFLSTNYPVMAAAAKFLLNHATKGTDGKLHTYPSNAHETQWDVHDPTTDVAAMLALFPATIKAATLLGRDSALVSSLKTANGQLRKFPRTDVVTQTKLLTPADDASGSTMFGMSDDPTAPVHNVENIGLEPVWPYNLVTDSGGTNPVAVRTFQHRKNVVNRDWSSDAIQAARLGLASDVATALVQLPKNFQVWPDGMANVYAQSPAEQAPYGEMVGVEATAVQEALVQDYDGLLRIAPAWPTTWDVAGTVFVQGGHRVHVQMQGGALTTVAIDAGSTGSVLTRNPWPGQSVTVVDGAGAVVVAPTTAAQFSIPVASGTSYLVRPAAATALPYAPVTGTPASTPKVLGTRTLGF
jgi:hypothetical protein